MHRRLTRVRKAAAVSFSSSSSSSSSSQHQPRTSSLSSPASLSFSRSLVAFPEPHPSSSSSSSLSTMATTATTTTPPPPRARRTYQDALDLLAQLQSNKTVISLFAASANPADVNASAMPEMTAWLARAGYQPADLARLRCIHVAGTKGKGSVSTLAAAVLARYPAVAGRVGTYTSPHLVSPRERICLDGAPIAPALFATCVFELWDRLSDAARRAGDADPDGPSTKPFYFRFLTLLALHVFLRERVVSAVVECGIGGEYDSTNVLPPAAVTACAVTQLGIDHVAMLGRTVAEIAWHKAGIFKPGVPAYTAQQSAAAAADGGALRVLAERAAEKGAALHVLDDAWIARWPGVGPGANLDGDFQKANMALAAVVARRHLQALGQRFDDDDGDFENAGAPLPRGDLADVLPAAFVAGLRAARLRGRCETIAQGRIRWYLDGAHTDDSLVQVAKWFAAKTTATAAARGRRDSIRVLVFNQQDRDAAALLQTLLEALRREMPGETRKIFHHAFCPTNELDGGGGGGSSSSSSSSKPDLSVQRRNCDVVRRFCPFTTATPAESVSLALDMARNVMLAAEKSRDKCDVHVLITGSFNLVGPALRLLEPDSEP